MKKNQSFEFYGKAGEYFRIWIVNIMLSIVTFGIYSAWAKVRTKRYFYNNTYLMNTPFDYVADPLKILKGRLIAVALFVAYSLSASFSPWIQFAVMLVLIPLIPFIVIRSLRFNHYNTSYRNIRFHFDAHYKNALWVFIVLPLCIALSIGLAYPYFEKEKKRFLIANSAFGSSEFDMQAKAWDFYKIYLKVSLLVISLLIFIGGMQFIISNNVDFGAGVFAAQGILFGLMLAFYPIFMLIVGYVYTQVTNLTFNHTQINACTFNCQLKTGTMCWLYFSNTLAIIFSFGLLIPWSKIRLTRYRLSCITLETETDLDDFIAGEAEKAEAIGEEVGDMLDLDVGL